MLEVSTNQITGIVEYTRDVVIDLLAYIFFGVFIYL